MKIYGIVASQYSGPCYHRVYLPLKEMGADCYFSNVLQEDKLEGVDIVFVNRLFPLNTVEEVEELKKKYGFKLVVDIDDFWQLDPSHLLHDLWVHSDFTRVIWETLKIADAITVTNEQLQREFKIPVHVLPNAIPNTGQFDVQRIESDLPRIFYQGSTTHVKDIQLLKGPMRRLQRNKFRTVLAGFHKDVPEWHIIADAFTNGLNYDSRIIPSSPPDTYYKAYAHADIAVCPLIDTKFNGYKSNLKVLEAARVGAAVVASNVGPYKNHKGVLLVNNQTDWFKHLNKLINDRNYTIEKGQEAKEYCSRKFNYQSINAERKQIFESLVS
jgi:glycosyltransferase involved in cell wall biosynthesis